MSQTQLLNDVAARFWRGRADDALCQLAHYGLRARFEGENTCWRTIVVGGSLAATLPRVHEAIAALPGAVFVFGYNVKDKDDETVWHETILPL